MTDETVTTAAAPAEADRKAALKAELVKRGLRPHPKFSEQRMIDLIAEHDTKPAPSIMKHADAIREQDGVTLVPNDEMAALKAKLAAAEAALAAKTAEPAPQPYNAPAGMSTTMNMNLPGALMRDEEDRRRLMEKCTQMGIAHLIPARANPDSIRDIIGRHMAENAQKLASQDALARAKAKGPQQLFVTMRVMKPGHLKISKGIHVPGIGDEMYEYNDIIECVPQATAVQYENTGMGEIVGQPFEVAA